MLVKVLMVPIIITFLIALIGMVGVVMTDRSKKRLKPKRQKRRDKRDRKNHSTLYSQINYAQEPVESIQDGLKKDPRLFSQGELSRRFLQSEVSKTPLSAGAKELYFRKQWTDLTSSIFQSLKLTSAYTRMPKAEVDYIKHDKRCTWELFYNDHKEEFTPGWLPQYEGEWAAAKNEDFLLCNSLNAWSSPHTGLPRGARVAMRKAQERISSLYI